MLKTNKLIVLLLSVNLFWACQPSHPEEKVEENTSLTQAANKPCYKQLSGTLGNVNVWVELIESNTADEHGDCALNAYYRYEKDGEPIGVFGKVDADGHVEMLEYNYEEGGEPHTIVGLWNSKKASFKGEWKHSNGKDRYPLVLEQTLDSPFVLTCEAIEDTLKAVSSLATSPEAVFSANWFEVQSEDEALAHFLNQEISKGMNEQPAEQMQTAMQKQIDDYFKAYKEQIEAEIELGFIDTSKAETLSMGLNHEVSLSMDIFYKSADLLSLAYTYYSYEGGAHGNYASTIAAYDLVDKKKITLKDILVDGYEEALSTALASAVRKKFTLGENTPLSEVLFENAISPNENFGLTDKGIFFVYAPYEVAAYAIGEIELFIPFDQIAAWVQGYEKADVLEEEKS